MLLYIFHSLKGGFFLLFPSRKVAKCNIDKADFMLDYLLYVTIFFQLLSQTLYYAKPNYMLFLLVL